MIFSLVLLDGSVMFGVLFIYLFIGFAGWFGHVQRIFRGIAQRLFVGLRGHAQRFFSWDCAALSFSRRSVFHFIRRDALHSILSRRSATFNFSFGRCCIGPHPETSRLRDAGTPARSIGGERLKVAGQCGRAGETHRG